MMIKKMPDREDIFVVGYPKSGNTWLTRLLARALDCTVARYTINDTNPEIASDLNSEVTGNGGKSISKLHLLPEEFENRFAPVKGRKVVYIKRDVKDILVSQFFYVKHKYPEEFVLKQIPREFLLRPGKMLRYLESRRRLRRYIKSFMGSGREQCAPLVHCNAWREYLSSRGGEIVSVGTSYEALIGNTFNELKRVIQELHEEAGDDDIWNAIRQEDFKNRRSEVEQSNTQLTFGKEFNLRFLRKGEPGDYKRFLTDRQISWIDKLTG